MRPAPRMIAASLLVLACARPWGAAAQGNPSADQIIKSLRPGAGMLGGTRGIRPVAPAPATDPAPEPARAGPSHAAPVRPPPPQAEAPSVNLTVQFANGSAELTPGAVKTLSELGRALSSTALTSYRFRIEGHTDTVGAADANKALSERRAQSVVAFLTGHFAIDPGRLDPVGLGEEGLLVQTPPNTAEARNRRVQVVNLGA